MKKQLLLLVITFIYSINLSAQRNLITDAQEYLNDTYYLDEVVNNSNKKGDFSIARYFANNVNYSNENLKSLAQSFIIYVEKGSEYAHQSINKIENLEFCSFAHSYLSLGMNDVYDFVYYDSILKKNYPKSELTLWIDLKKNTKKYGTLFFPKELFNKIQKQANVLISSDNISTINKLILETYLLDLNREIDSQKKITEIKKLKEKYPKYFYNGDATEDFIAYSNLQTPEPKDESWASFYSYINQNPIINIDNVFDLFLIPSDAPKDSLFANFERLNQICDKFKGAKQLYRYRSVWLNENQDAFESKSELYFSMLKCYVDYASINQTKDYAEGYILTDEFFAIDEDDLLEINPLQEDIDSETISVMKKEMTKEKSDSIQKYIEESLAIYPRNELLKQLSGSFNRSK